MYKRLKTLLSVQDVTQVILAKKLGKSQGYINFRLNHKKSFTLHEMYAICDMLEVPYHLIPIFFPKDGVDLTAKELTAYLSYLNKEKFEDILSQLLVCCG